MGFSVSGATALLFVGMFISFGIAYSAAFNGFERVSDAYEDDTDRALARQNTALNVANAQWDGVDTLNVTVENTGARTLAVNDTDVLVDGDYVTDFAVREVEGDADTDLWLPGETLHVEITTNDAPTRVKVVSGPGVAATAGVT